ncbi:MAG: B12-binding domain-containing radical SAM protein [Actinomycetota bacterium]
MKILFVTSHLFFSEPLGVMLLSAIAKKKGHQTRLCVLTRQPMEEALREFEPDLVGYSTITANEHIFVEGDNQVKEYMHATGRKVWRIMGGPHATYFPEVLDKMGLDAIVVGHGDNALPAILDRIEAGRDFSGIPNVLASTSDTLIKEVVEDLDALPFLDRSLIYDFDPNLQQVGIRSFQTQRGCPYKCTYCFNHAYNRMFKGEGRKLFVRRSVDHLLAEIKYVRETFPEMRFLRFSDDVFAIRADAWLEEFAERYPREVGLPFYCLIRADGLVDDVGRLLKKAGCQSVSMSIETGVLEARNAVLKRNMPDEVLLNAYAVARKYGIYTHSNTMLGLPGTTLDQDFQSIAFARKAAPTAATFSVFCPFPRTELTEYAKMRGVLPDNFDYNNTYRNESVLTNYTAMERRIQLNLSYLGPIFCNLPDFMQPMLKPLASLPLPSLYNFVGSIFNTYLLSFRIFRGARPNDPVSWIRNAWRAVNYYFLSGQAKKRRRRSASIATAATDTTS